MLLLHGLFGDGANLGKLATALSCDYCVHSLDLRNHGKSPHHVEMTYLQMMHDVVHYMDQHGIDKSIVIGHSMGGKVAMTLALNYPERVRALIIADIAPVKYTPHHERILEGLRALNIGRIKDRKTADTQLSVYIPDVSVRQFILKSLVKDGSALKWRMNVPAIINNYDAILDAPSGKGPYTGPTLFIAGGNSDYIKPKYRKAVLDLFPEAKTKIIEGAAHWLHAEKPETFHRVCNRFLRECCDASADYH